jgi:hypothetical protein
MLHHFIAGAIARQQARRIARDQMGNNKSNDAYSDHYQQQPPAALPQNAPQSHSLDLIIRRCANGAGVRKETADGAIRQRLRRYLLMVATL